MGEFRAKVKGAFKEATSVVQGRPGIFALLAGDHGEVASLLDQAIRTSSLEKRNALLERIRVELLSHSQAEDETFYATLEEHPETRHFVEESRSDHQVVASRLREALSDRGGPQQGLANLERLRDAVEHHVAREENEIFAQAQELIPDEESSHLAARFVQLKETKRNRL